jgi:hypothetical protein
LRGPKALLLARAGITPPPGHPLRSTPPQEIVANWIIGTSDLYRVPEAPPYNREFINNNGVLAWSTGEPFGRYVAWAAYLPATQENICEVLTALTDGGDVLDAGDGTVAAQLVVRYFQPRILSAAGPTIAPAQRYYQQAALAVSDIPYRVNPSETDWLVVHPDSGAFVGVDYEYDIAGGTPAGMYDFRVACQNTNQAAQLIFPPPPLQQSNLVPGSSDVGAFRWEQSPSWNPSNPTSPRYDVYSYIYTFSQEPPPDFPRPTPGLWTDLTHPPADVVSLHQNQSGVLTNYGVRFFDATQQTVWALHKSWTGKSLFRYRYATTMQVTDFGNRVRIQPGHIYQTEEVAFVAEGLRIVTDGVVTYDDLSNGVVQIVRTNEEPFPSKGGQLLLTAPSKTKTFRGLAQASTPGDRHYLIPHALPRAGGDVWVLVADQATATSSVTHAVVSIATEVPVTLPDASFTVSITEVDGRLWIFGYPLVSS